MAIAPQQPVNINPYNLVPSSSPVGQAYTGGLTPIATALAPGPTLVLLQNALLTYLTSLNYFPATPAPDMAYKISGIIGNIYNAYVQPDRAYRHFYSPAQLDLIEQIMEQINNMLLTQTLSSSNVFFLQEECIENSDLTEQEKFPLWLAMTLIETAYNDLYSICLSPPAGTWAVLIDTNPAINVMNLRNWINGIFAGTLIGYTQSKPLVPIDASDGAGIGENFYTGVAGALLLTFGTSVFQWSRKPMPIY